MENWSEIEKERLLSNRFIEKVTNSQVSFTTEFKILAVKANLDGQSPKDFFMESGIDVSLLSDDLPKKCVSRWRKVYLEKGAKGFGKENRGLAAKGRPKEKFASAEAELAYLRLENEFLKKLHALANSKEKKSSR